MIYEGWFAYRNRSKHTRSTSKRINLVSIGNDTIKEMEAVLATSCALAKESDIISCGIMIPNPAKYSLHTVITVGLKYIERNNIKEITMTNEPQEFKQKLDEFIA